MAFAVEQTSLLTVGSDISIKIQYVYLYVLYSDFWSTLLFGLRNRLPVLLLELLLNIGEHRHVVLKGRS